jgi:hypothetical protein
MPQIEVHASILVESESIPSEAEDKILVAARIFSTALQNLVLMKAPCLRLPLISRHSFAESGQERPQFVLYRSRTDPIADTLANLLYRLPDRTCVQLRRFNIKWYEKDDICCAFSFF